MSPCPVCQTEYSEGKINYCTTCGWNVTPYPLTFTGQVPEAFLARERAKISWAKDAWTRLQSQIIDLKQENLQQKVRLKDLQTQISQVEAELKATEQLEQELTATKTGKH